MKIRALDVFTELEEETSSVTGLDTVLDLTIDGALKLALSNSVNGELSSEWYEDILSKLGEIEQNAFTMGLATEGIRVTSAEKNDLKKKKKIKKRNEPTTYQTDVKEQIKHPNIKNLKASIIDEDVLAEYVDQRVSELKAGGDDTDEDELRTIAMAEVTDHIIGCLTNATKKDSFIDKYTKIARKAVLSSPWVKRCLKTDYVVSDILEKENFVLDSALTVLGAKAGIWDGRWDKYFGSENAVIEVAEDIRVKIAEQLTSEDEEELKNFVDNVSNAFGKDEGSKTKKKIDDKKEEYKNKEKDPVEKEIEKVANAEFSEASSKAKITFDNGTIFSAYIAKSDAQKQKGLEVFSSLNETEAMLFPFDKKQHTTFHMGSVSFPIDVLFIQKDASGTLIVSKIIHSSHPNNNDSWSENDVDSVLEVNGGLCKNFNIEVGSECKTSLRITQGSSK